jgi:hypothetical protein
MSGMTKERISIQLAMTQQRSWSTGWENPNIVQLSASGLLCRTLTYVINRSSNPVARNGQPVMLRGLATMEEA